MTSDHHTVVSSSGECLSLTFTCPVRQQVNVRFLKCDLKQVNKIKTRCYKKSKNRLSRANTWCFNCLLIPLITCCIISSSFTFSPHYSAFSEAHQTGNRNQTQHVSTLKHGVIIFIYCLSHYFSVCLILKLHTV